MIKKMLSIALSIMLAVIMLIPPESVSAAQEYMSAQDAKYFLSFVYNADADNVEASDLSDDIYYKMLTGEYSGNKKYELAAQAAFFWDFGDFAPKGKAVSDGIEYNGYFV